MYLKYVGMNMKIIRTCVILLVVMLCACGKQQQGNRINMYDIQSAFYSSDKMAIDELVDSIWYLPLETNDESVLTPTNWYNYVFTDSSILVLNDNALYRFTYDGKYTNKVCQRGFGPSDIGYLNQIAWNESRKELYAWDGMNVKLLVYDEFLNYKEYIPFRTMGFLLPYKDCFLVGKRRDDFMKFGTDYVVDKLDISTGEKVSYVKSRISPITVSMPPMFAYDTYICNYEDCIYIKEHRSDSVFRLFPNDGRVEFAFGFNIGEIQPAELDYPGDQEQRKKAAQYIMVERFYETKDYLFVKVKHNYEYHYFMCSKQNGSVKKLYSNKHNAYDGGIPLKEIIPINNSLYLGGVIWPSSFLEEDFIESIKSVSVIDEKARNRMLRLIEGIGDEDNPVIVFVKLKEQYE